MKSIQYISNSCSNEYRFAFNGKENDNEVKGVGNSIDFGARIYDSRIGRFLSIDPRWKEFPDWSTYLFAVNNPIRLIDEDGEGPKDRVAAAKMMIGKTYSQNRKSDNKDVFSKEAFSSMDCSELVGRVLFADGITSKIKLTSASGIKDLLSDKSKFTNSSTPKVGDIAIFNGHVGIVSKVGKNGTFSLIHARGVGKLSGEQNTPITAEQYKAGNLVGFFRPKQENETPDGDGFNNPLTGEKNKQENTNSNNSMPSNDSSSKEADDITYSGGTLSGVEMTAERPKREIPKKTVQVTP